MINIKELRLGNWVKAKYKYGDKEPNFLQVENIQDDFLNQSYYCWGEVDDYISLSDTDPIPLTEDILVKCGFENVSEDANGRQFKYTISEVMVLYIVPGISGAYLWYSSDAGETTLSKLEYKCLHQLQNLIYSLTGQELEFKP